MRPGLATGTRYQTPLIAKPRRGALQAFLLLYLTHTTIRAWKLCCSHNDKKKARDLFDRNKPLFEDFWYTCLDLGRLPANDEFEQHERIRQIVNSHNKAFNLCREYFDESSFKQAAQERTDDLLVYFALGFFKKRDAYTRMPLSLQRDIKAFFGNYTEARNLGKTEIQDRSKKEDSSSKFW